MTLNETNKSKLCLPLPGTIDFKYIVPAFTTTKLLKASTKLIRMSKRDAWFFFAAGKVCSLWFKSVCTSRSEFVIVLLTSLTGPRTIDPSGEEDQFSDILTLIELLTHLLSKDYIDFDVTGKFWNVHIEYRWEDSGRGVAGTMLWGLSIWVKSINPPKGLHGNLGRSFDVFHSTSNDNKFDFFIFWTDHWGKLQKINTGNPFYVLIVFKGYKTMHGCVYLCIQITNSRDRIDYHLKSTCI